jgi:hypothetical protein
MRALFFGPMRTFAGLCALSAIGLFGCSDASGSLQGGDLILDAGQPSVTPSDDGGTGGTTWTSLYADFFGPSGSATCSGGACHDATGNGAVFWVCGADATSCWQGMITGGAYGSLVPSGGAMDPTTTELYTVLCKADTSLCKAAAHTPCLMPQGCSHSFATTELGRIEAWIKAGAQNN